MRPDGWMRSAACGRGLGWVRAGIAVLAVASGAAGQEPAPAPAPRPVTYLLWSDGPPGVALDARGVRPTLTLHRPPATKANGAAVVVCPGGGYQGLAAHEADPIAAWLNGLGITAVVLRYRLGPDFHHPAMLEDAARAIRTTRANAQLWQVDPNRVAILGFSAGGHLASTAGTHFDAGQVDAADPIDRQSSRPDRLILLYPVISMREPMTHAGSKRNLLGTDPAPDLVASLSNETQVRPETPPTFIAHTDADSVVPAENPLLFTLALRQARVPVEFHLFEAGRHGLGLGQDGSPFGEWPHLCERWLAAQGFLKAAP